MTYHVIGLFFYTTTIAVPSSLRTLACSFESRSTRAIPEFLPCELKRSGPGASSISFLVLLVLPPDRKSKVMASEEQNLIYYIYLL